MGVGDDLDAEHVGEAGATVVAKGAEDEVLALLVEDEDSGEHRGGGDGGPVVEARRRAAGVAWLSPSLMCRDAQSIDVAASSRCRGIAGARSVSSRHGKGSVHPCTCLLHP